MEQAWKEGGVIHLLTCDQMPVATDKFLIGD